MSIQEIMTRNPETVDVATPVKRVVQKLFELDVRHVPVMSGNEVVGIISSHDLTSQAWSLLDVLEIEGSDLDFIGKQAKDVMSSSLVSVGPESSVGEAVDLIIENKIGALLVVDPHDQSLSGIVSYVDILASVRERL